MLACRHLYLALTKVEIDGNYSFLVMVAHMLTRLRLAQPDNHRKKFRYFVAFLNGLSSLPQSVRDYAERMAMLLRHRLKMTCLKPLSSFSRVLSKSLAKSLADATVINECDDNLIPCLPVNRIWPDPVRIIHGIQHFCIRLFTGILTP